MLGFDFGDRIRGPVSVVTGEPDSDGVRQLAIDLTDAALDFPEIAWRKAAGRPASAVVRYSESGETLNLRTIEIVAPGLSAAGLGEVRGGALQRLAFHDISVSGLGRFSLQASRQDDVLVTAVEADELTVSRGLFSGGGGGDGAPFRLSVVAGRLRTEGGSLRDMRLTLGTRGGVIERFDLSATLDGGGQLRGLMGEQTGAIRILSSDAGAFLRLIDLYGRAQGGALALVLRPDLETGALSGSLNAENFRVVGEPAMGQLLATEEQLARNERDDVRDQRTPAAARESADNVIIDRLAANFTRTADVLTIREAFVRGPSVGITLRGTVGYAANRVSLTGTYIPAYQINNFFSRIPILGQALGGRQSEGLLGVTFEVTGPAESPNLRINPASVLAPGLLRSLFDFR